MTSSSPALPPPPCPALYVGDLAPEVSEIVLVGAFAHFGPLASVRVCRDRRSGLSLGYGYVNFTSFAHAVNAMMAMNHADLKGKPIRVMWSRRDPQWRRNGVGNIFVKNFGDLLTELELERLFGEHGRVESCKVALDEHGKSKGFGFVQMDSEAAAISAIHALNGSLIPGSRKTMFVSMFVRRNAREALPKASQPNNLYIKNLDWHITDDILRETFARFGEIISVVVMKDYYGRSRGFGFVKFRLSNCAKNALDAINGSKIGSKFVYVSWAQKRAERDEWLRLHYADKYDQSMLNNESSIVCVRNLNEYVHDNALLNLFVGCGKVIWARVMHDQNGLSRGFGFVCFSSAQEAKMAVTNFDGIMYNGRNLRLTVEPDRQRHFQLPYALSYGYPQHWGWFQMPLNVNPLNLPQYNGLSCYTTNQDFQLHSPPTMGIAYGWPVQKSCNGFKV